MRSPNWQQGALGWFANDPKARSLGFMAGGGISDQDFRSIRPSKLSGRENEFLTALAQRWLKQFVKGQRLTAIGPLRLRKAFRFDIERDGRLEVVALFDFPVKPSEYGDFLLGKVEVAVVARSNPYLRSLLVVGPFAFDALEAVDVDGDGRAEILLQHGVWHPNFDLHSLRGDQYMEVWGEGLSSGC